MLPLFDMLNNAQNGDAIEALARQFNLSQQQAQAAVEALLPAFSQGLKRNVADPYGFGAFLTAMASGQHGKYFEDAANAFSPQGIQQGNDILRDEDFATGIATQKGLGSGAYEGLLYGHNERGPQYFHEWVNWYLQGDPSLPKPVM